MKYRGRKYKRKSASTGSGSCCYCDVAKNASECNRIQKCVTKDVKKGNTGFYKEVI